MYDLSTSKEIQITNNRSVNHLAIYSDRIVWDDWNDAKSIYMYDLSTKKETQITTSGSAGTPSIYGNRIVWLDDRNGKLSFYSYDLSTNKGTQITNGKLSISQAKLDIYNNIIVWVDDRNGNSDIYMGTISSGETKPKLPVTSFSASPTSGPNPERAGFNRAKRTGGDGTAGQ
jgi:beta propeller repeat protein